jgi:hypothetical protein
MKIDSDNHSSVFSSTPAERGNRLVSVRRSILKSFAWPTTLLAGAAALALITVPDRAQASVTFDNFNVNEGHFTGLPNASSGLNIAASSTADRVTTGVPLEGTGHQKLVFNATTAGSAIRVRHLSGGGTPANNTAFNTSAGDDGWIGFYLKADATTDPNWTVQLWIEGASVNGGIPKTIICDGTYHLYEWNLDDNSGGPDGWGSIASLATGSATVTDGSHTIDSIVFRNSSGPAASTFYLDYVAKSDSGSVSNLVGQPCLATSSVLMDGPIATNSTQVTVTGVTAGATKVTVYQDSGAGMVAVGSKTTGITAGTNTVTVSGLVRNAQVAATQTVAGQEGCIPSNGLFVGGGANGPIRVALSLRETSSLGPVGAPAGDTNSAVHFLGATTVSGNANGGAPTDGMIIYPSNQWQTVTFQSGSVSIGDVASATGTLLPGAGYNANDFVDIEVYAYKKVNGSTAYSATPASTLSTMGNYVYSNDVFKVQWTWPAVAGATGYRLVRDYYFAGFIDYVDVTNTSYMDANTGWITGPATVSPNTIPLTPSIQWAPSVGNPNHIATPWAVLESIAFAIDVPAGTGPYDIYIDNLKNGTTVFQTFEGGASGAQNIGFRPPGFSSTTAGTMLANPSVGQLSNATADTGSNSFHLQFQWSGTNDSKWLRLTTSGLGDPVVNLADPISFRILMLPVGSSVTPPARPVMTATRVGNSTVLNWTGTHGLQSAPAASGPYTTINGVTSGPYTNVNSGSQMFFRLVN